MRLGSSRARRSSIGVPTAALVASITVGLEGTALAEEFQISPASVMPTPSSRAWAAIDVNALPRAQFEAIGFKELDELSYRAARLEARMILMGALLEVAETHVTDPVLDPEVYESLGDEIVNLYTEGSNELTVLKEKGEDVLDQVDDYCKKRPWKCHKVMSPAKSVVGNLDVMRVQLLDLKNRARGFVTQGDESAPIFEGVERTRR